MNSIFLCDIKNVLSANELEAIKAYLSAEEIQNAEIIKDRLRRNIYMQANAFKKIIVAKVLEKPLTQIFFYKNAYGKPFVVQEPESQKLFFNISYTHGQIALILSDSFYTGIDIERICMRTDLQILQQILFNAEEANEAAIINNSALAIDFFFRTWVIKECYLKAIGVGFNTEPSSLSIKKISENLFEINAGKNADETNNFLISYYKTNDFSIAFTTPQTVIQAIKNYYFDGHKFLRK